MEDHFIKALVEIISSSGIILFILFSLFLSIFGILMPFFVIKIMNDVSSIKNKMDEIIGELRR
jgi:hypothetical protein